MKHSVSIYLSAVAGMVISVTAPVVGSAQVPEPGSVPRLVVPQRQPAAPVAQPPGQPTAVAPSEPAPVTPVTGAAGVTPVGAAPAPTSSSSQAATAAGRSYGAAHFGLTLEGVPLGMVQSADGGTATGQVVVETAGPDRIAAKHVAGVKHEQIVLVTDLQSPLLNDWIAAAWKGTPLRKSGSIQAADYNYTIVSEREFTNALLVETTLPVLDGGSKEPARLTVKLAPEHTRLKPGSGAKTQSSAGAKVQKKWLASNFRFEMGGLDGSKVTKIDSFTVRQTVADNAVGEMRDYQKEPAGIDFPNLRITLSTASSQTWADWHEDFVVKGNNGNDKERNGAIIFLGPTLKEELGRVNLFNCGIFRLAPERRNANSDQITRTTADLYCERMEFVGAK